MDKWETRFLELAHHISRWSKDPSTQVGCVIVDPTSRRVLSMGFNGLPAGVEDTAERLENRSIKYEMIVHAEQNALLSISGVNFEKSDLYVTPLPPCARCAGLIIQAGIGRVICPRPDRHKKLWIDQARIAEEMFKEASVNLIYASGS